MTLSIQDTLTRTKREFVPREQGKVAMYVCGPTVYNHIHVGNARSSLVFDVIRRYLIWSGYSVTFVQNHTDVDDRIIDKANEEGRDASEVARQYSQAFEDVTRRLGILPPDVLVKATDHIADMIEMIRSHIEKGYAYESGGSVWFAVETFKGYGKLSGRTLDDVRAGERVEPDPNKRQPLDFALWKAAKPGEPAWESPWGPGRPGWHIECSAMSIKQLGMGFDIHGGGSDLIFPHHENEIAQSEAAYGSEPFAHYWMHNGMVNVDETKMSKSLGNFWLAKDALGVISPATLRMMSIAAHYRSDVDFGEASIEQARKALERFEIFLRQVDGLEGDGVNHSIVAQWRDRFASAMDDDFNTPLAIGVMHELLREGNIQVQSADTDDGSAAGAARAMAVVLRDILGALGFDLSVEASDPRSVGLIELALSLREKARSAGRFDEADDIRDRLSALGVILEDSASGTRWRLKV